MPALSTITLPDGNTYDLEPANREAVNIITEYTGSETNFNALEVSTVKNVNYYKIKSPDDDILWQWSDDDSSKLITAKKIYPNGGIFFKNQTALPNQTAAATYYVMCIDAFSNGGQAKYCTATSSATGNTIVTRQANGYIYATYFNQSSGEENLSSYTSYVAFFSSDGFLRKTSKAHFQIWMGLTDSGTKTLNATYRCYYRKFNGICIVSVDYRSTVSSTITVGTLPAGYRPHTVLMAANATGGTNSSYLQIDTAGVVKLAKVGSGGYCIATITYPTTS